MNQANGRNSIWVNEIKLVKFSLFVKINSITFFQYTILCTFSNSKMKSTGKLQLKQRNENRNNNEMQCNMYKDLVKEDRMDRLRQETEMRANSRREARIQKQANEEYMIADKIAKEQEKRERIKTDKINLDAIAAALSKQKNEEISDSKIRQGLRENSPEIRELMVKLNTALVNQNLDNQIHEKVKKVHEEKLDQLMQDAEMIRRNKEEQERIAAEERAKAEELRSYRECTRQQLEEKKRRKKLLEEAERINDKELMMEKQKKDREEWLRQEQLRREKQEKHRQEIEEFVKQRERMKELERKREEEEMKRIDQYKQDVDERLSRAIEEQKRRDAEREKLAQNIASRIAREQNEREEYEQLLVDLAAEKELERLKQKELEEAEKIRKQHEEMMKYMQLDEEAKRKKLRLSQEEERRLKLQIVEEQKKLAELAELEQEKNRIRVEKFRRELSKQLVEKKELYEAAKQAELYRLQLEQEREARRQEMIEEERRKLVVNHILKMGPESIKYLPKGVLREDDLNYLPPVYRDAIFKSKDLQNIL